MNYPALNRAVIDLKATLCHDFFDIAIAQRIRQVPPDALEYHLLLKVSPFEADNTEGVLFEK